MLGKVKVQKLITVDRTARKPLTATQGCVILLTERGLSKEHDIIQTLLS